MIINTEYKPHRQLGESDADWDLLKDMITTYLQNNADKATVEETDLRDLDLKFRDDALWRQIAGDLGLVTIG